MQCKAEFRIGQFERTQSRKFKKNLSQEKIPPQHAALQSMNIQSENISRQDSEFCDDKRHPEKSSITQKKELKINLTNEISILANLYSDLLGLLHLDRKSLILNLSVMVSRAPSHPITPPPHQKKTKNFVNPL